MKKCLLFFISFLAFQSLIVAQQQLPWCGTDMVLEKLNQQHPNFAAHMHKSMSNAAKRQSQTNGVQKLTLIVPVVVHVIHDNGIGNISDEQVMDGLRILNEDYNRMNPDTANTRNTPTAPFQSVAGTMDIEFKLAKRDPAGNCTNGIVRVNAPDLTYNAGDDCKYSANGGSDQWPMDKYLNIWVVNSIDNSGAAGIILGYAYLPYWPNGANFGILIRNDSFGTIETAVNSDGRTLTHEMGHLLGLQHIFDAGWSGTTGCHTGDCFQNGDYSCDTPPQAAANWSCSQTWNSCPDVPVNDAFGFDAVDQIENYMSYNYCQNMFSWDQVGIMQQNFVDIDFMSNWIMVPNHVETGVNEPEVLCKADFETAKQQVCVGDSIQFIDRSFHNPSSWTWTITPGLAGVHWDVVNGGSTGTQDPYVRFYVPGFYSVSLSASDGSSSDQEVKADFIKVLPTPTGLPFWEGFESISSLLNADRWVVANPGNNNAFEVSNSAAYGGNRAVRLMNYGQSGVNSDELISSGVDLSALSSTDPVTLSFRYAYRKRTSSNDEWLKVFVSKDCGDSWVQRKTLHGSMLSNVTASSSWSPQSLEDWVTIHMVNITPDFYVQPFRFKFEFEGNGGNNFYLDDINIYQGNPSNDIVLGLETNPEIQGLSLYPNPTDGDLHLAFSVDNANETFISLKDIAGKEIRKFAVQANAGQNMVLLNVDGIAKGSYWLSITMNGATQSLAVIVN
jgi:PKD repeat protein